MTDYSIKRFNRYSDDELLAALGEVAQRLDTEYVPGRTFQDSTGISLHTIERRFGTWKKFCEKAGFKSAYNRTSSKHELLKNLNEVWQKLGRQPRSREMKRPLSAISHSRYRREFGSWHQTCVQFLAWKSGVSAKDIDKECRPSSPSNDESGRYKTARAISLSLRYEVLKRDNFRCVKCGKTPAKDLGVQLHIDHRVPYSTGGETELSNLQTTCSDCNLGKGNRHSE